MSEVTNPIQACSEIFYKPSPVLYAVGKQDNWSWLPFILVTLFMLTPIYLYFGAVDFEWFKQITAAASLPDASPAEVQNLSNQMGSLAVMKWSYLVGAGIGAIIIYAVLALYLTLMTKSDPENVHSFLDWYGLMWWVNLPSIIVGLISTTLILLTVDGQIPVNILTPTTPAYWLSIDQSSQWFSLLSSFRLETLWTIYLTAVGITQWTSIKTSKATLIAAAPTLVILSLMVIWQLIF